MRLFGVRPLKIRPRYSLTHCQCELCNRTKVRNLYYPVLHYPVTLSLSRTLRKPKTLPSFVGNSDGSILNIINVVGIFTAQCLIVQSAVLRSHVVRLSVRPSVTLVDCDHIGWTSWKLTAQTFSSTSSLFIAQRRRPSGIRLANPRRTWGHLGETRGGVLKKWRARELNRQYLGKVTIDGLYRNSPTLFRKVPYP